MKYLLALLLAASAVSLSPVQAGASAADLARANCTKAILASAAQVTRGDIKNFHMAPSGSGFEMSGLDENHKPVSCEAAADGHVTWIHGG